MSAIHHYDVFLSFRGPDTRQGLTDCIYHSMIGAGIRVFRDDDELSAGQPIDTILLAINNSKVCIPVLSPTFASSAWCLREVAKMVELKKEIIPIFAGVTPDDVKLRSSVYGVDMVKHERAYEKELVKQWKDALKEIATIKGRELKDKGFSKFSKELTNEVLKNLKINKKDVPSYLPSVDDQVETVLKLLDVESGGVRCVGIHGMGGVGKTTLAKVLFNRLSATFDSCCFLPDIVKSSKDNGIENLRKELLYKLDPKLREITHNTDWDAILEKICEAKVLIVLDDVGENTHIDKLVGKTNLYASGSRIIVTSRDAGVFKIGSKPFDETFELKGMTFIQGLQLFSHHAFRTEIPPEDLRTLSEEVVICCKGLPLALEVLGSLFGQTAKSKWLDTVRNLQKVPDPTISSTLKISYESLEHKQQQIFLDVACFFIGAEKSYVSYMWEACGFAPALALDVLVSKSLIKIIKDDKLWMHDLLRDLGREIVREEGRQESKRCSRLWEQSEEMMDIVRTEKGKKGLVGLCLKGPCPSTMEEVLKGSQNLRFLSLENAKFCEKFKYPLPQLKWLSMRACPLSFSVSLRNLVILELPDSSINEKWKGWNNIEIVYLKVLDLTNCTKLTCTPNFSKMRNLERLTLCRCTKLVKVHHSISALRNLKYLDLSQCSSLHKLPEEIGCLENLEEMYVHGCTKLVNFPSSLGKLKSLIMLDISGKPDSIDMMSMINLFTGSPMHEDVNISLPSGFFDQSLTGPIRSAFKFLRDTGLARPLFDEDGLPGIIRILPGIFSQHNGLQLPDIFGDLRSLTKLDLSYLSVSSLPESIGCLENLVELKAKQTFLVTLPKSIGQLKKLEALNLASSVNLKEIPEEIGGLSNLRTLNLSWTDVRQLPSTITQLSLLQSLSLANCDKLGQHKDGSNSSESSEQVRSAANALPTSFSDLSQLEILALSCTHLKCIPAIPSSLRHLSLYDLSHMVELPDTSNNRYLEYLSLSFSGGKSKVENLEGLPESLRELRVMDVDALPDLSYLKNLRKLVVHGGDLKVITGLAKLESLEELVISNCESLESLENLSELKNLKYISISWCAELRVVEGLDRLNLLQEDLHFSNCGCSKCVAVQRPSRMKQLLSWVQDRTGASTSQSRQAIADATLF